MYETFCTHCGAGEDGTVTVTKTPLEQTQTNPTLLLSADYRYEFECHACDITETVETGVFPEDNTDAFYIRPETEDAPTKCLINGTEVQYRDIDDQTVESALIKHDGVTTSRMHHVHVHAINPPTFSKGNAHRVQIEDFLDQRMMLGDIRYHNSKHRTLKFFRGLDDGILNMYEDMRANDDFDHDIDDTPHDDYR